MTDSVDDKLHSDAPVVVIEAPAGFGKTTTAARYAKEAAGRLPSGGKVLLLSHTHAACGEFQRKCLSDKQAVDVETCDGFFLKAIAPYAGALDLPMPLESHLGRGGSGVAFSDLSRKACELFRRAPTIARRVAACYPIIVLDEHQDASTAQHEAVWLLREIGESRLRVLGDPMQAIHMGTAETYVDWDRLSASADATDTLEKPHRWCDARELGEWIKAARSTLKAGNPLSLRGAPAAVSVSRYTKLAGRERFVDGGTASAAIHGFLDDAPHKAVILAFLGEMAWTVAQLGRWRAPINEGAQLDELGGLISDMEQHAGNAERLAHALLAFLSQIGVGLNEALRTGLCARLGSAIDRKRAGDNQLAWLACLEPIYDSPDHRGIAVAVRAVRNATLGDYRIRLNAHVWALSSFDRTDDPRGFCSTLGRIRRQRQSPAQMVSTIHKAKGLEFDHVFLCPVDRHQYSANALGARLLYVALSRARLSLRLAVATDALPGHVSLV